mgnify:CR=1 FL=1
MGFFDELGKKISDASQDVMQKGKEMADTAKFNSMIHDEEKKITAVYSKIGKKYFEDFKNAPAEGFKDFVDEIHAAQAKIAEIQEKLKALKDDVTEKVENVAEKAKDAAEKAKDVASSTVEQVAEDAKAVAAEGAAKVEDVAAKVEETASNAADAISKE